jgi:hypothetical protein
MKAGTFVLNTNHMHNTIRAALVICLILLLQPGDQMPYAQVQSAESIKNMIVRFKNDVRGPYKDIRWFCKDGTIIPPREKCPEPGGNQRARYKDEVELLAKTNHIFLGQILATTPKEAFLDASNHYSRLKQYHLEQYLKAVDNGWVLQKAQYYRGAFQSEDESAWGVEFLEWLLQDEETIDKHFFLLRQSVRAIPHKAETVKSYNIRAVSKAISDAYPEFQDLRIKIHGQPEESDIKQVQLFLNKHRSDLSGDLQKQLEILIEDLQATFRPVDLAGLKSDIQKIPVQYPFRSSLLDYVNYYQDRELGSDFTIATAEKIAQIRSQLSEIQSAKVRLVLFDLSNDLEEIFYIQSTKWQPETAGEAAEKICFTAMAAMGSGYLEKWEWDEISGELANYSTSEMTLGSVNDLLDAGNNLVQWGSGMVRGVYQDVVNTYGAFEPLAYGFIDDKIRGSALLSLGNTLGQLGNFFAEQSNLTNKILDLHNPSAIRGLNPGIALGQLVVVEETQPEKVEQDKIYVFQYAPSDLKPVAGILTVSEGNMVSHVQLLARNLGIPNAVISPENFQQLKAHQGEKVFYAVSNRRNVLIRPESQMTAEERELFETKSRNDERITVPVEKINLEQRDLINLRAVDASTSGKICGPKAANLGQLKYVFPDHVVEGVVLPFGTFRQHLDQTMPGQNVSYWQFLNHTFQQSESLRNQQTPETKIDSFILTQLSLLREAIKKITLSTEFVQKLERSFTEAFGKPIGEVPVFLRSDTNMEDLKDFTGAGLNLTVFNVVHKEAILQGIKDVWASPYTERSFRWRQRYLLNPENVFPSILIIPSVDVDFSGVLITRGVTTSDPRDITVAFSRGAGGAVEGQVAESYLLDHQGKNHLLAPAREPQYRRLPAMGGTSTHFATFDKRILSDQNLFNLRTMAQLIKKQMPQYLQTGPDDPLDVELGFQDNKIWLFQIRPFVENKNALNLTYLEKISPPLERNKIINMTIQLP